MRILALVATSTLLCAGGIGLPYALATPYTDINAAAAKSKITVERLRRNVSALEGSGGNIGVLTGPDGILMVDAGIAVSKAKIVAALRSLSSERLRYVIDTHWHWDHTDGNGWARRAGANIIADEKTVEHLRQTINMVEWEHTFTPVPANQLPNMPITTDKTLHMDGETIIIRRLKPGHTDGDLVVYFMKADVLQTGDTFWNGIYPFIDYETGGSIDGAIRAANDALMMSTDHTIIIPGHGPVGNRAQLVEFRDMLVGVRNRVAAEKAQGKTLDQVIADDPTAPYDAKWGGSVVNPSLFTTLVYRGV